MGVIAAITVPADEFEFGRLFHHTPRLSMHLERLVPSGTTLIPYCWTPTEQVERIIRLGEGSPVVDEVTVIDETNEETFFRIDLVQEQDMLLTTLNEANGTLLEGVLSGDSWYFEIRFTARNELSTFFQRCSETDLFVHLEGMYPTDTPREVDDLPLSAEQVELVQQAFEEGYYDIPQQTTLTELSEQVAVSERTVATQLRAAEATVLKAVL